MRTDRPIRVLYSFPQRLGVARVCYTAWQQVNGLAAAGAEVVACPGSLGRPLPASVTVRPTLARGKWRLPYRILGRSLAFGLHDWLVSRRLPRPADRLDVVHTWPLGALRTLRAAKRLGIATVLERPNAHTRFAYEIVQRECQHLGMIMPPGHEHAFNRSYLLREEAEYQLADRLLCPSDFVVKTFLDRGFSGDRLARHQYGFDETRFYPSTTPRDPGARLRVLFAGGCAPRKGLHYALDAWLRSPAHDHGEFLIAGEFMPGYAERLSEKLSHRSVRRLGFRTDVPELMRQSDILILPSIEEGSALVTSEARGSGCVLLVSEAAGAICTHLENALVHRVGDVDSLAVHLTMLDQDRRLLERLRAASLSTINDITWTAAGRKLLEVYGGVTDRHSTSAGRTRAGCESRSENACSLSANGG